MFRHLLSALSPAGRKAQLSILIFHRVRRHLDPVFPNELDARRFDAVCRWVRNWFHVLPLDAAVQHLRRGELPARALAITFDDGYADNHDVALPILRRHDLPATFFIATGFLDGGRMWNDTIIESLRHCEAASLDLGGLGPAGLGLFDLGSTQQRRNAIDKTLDEAKYLDDEERLALTERVAARAHVRPPVDLMMTSGQVRELRRAGMQVGAHTVSHPILARLADDKALSEMVNSKRRLEEILDEPISLFAYPNGRPGEDFNERSVELARHAGFNAAVSTAKGTGTAASDLFQLPRFTPWGSGRTRFGTQLAANLWAGRR
jgi:peptidoglycan/xylan/chitin deacetylase (PgdA/CDA1 family)